MRLRRSLVALATAGLVALTIAPAALGAGPRAIGPIGAILPPVAVNDSMTVKHDRTKTVAAPGVLDNDLQLGGGYTAVLTTDAAHGNLNLHADGGYVYSPDSGYVGPDAFKYKIDGGLLGLSNIATVSIQVTNAAPVAHDDSYTAVTGVSLTVPAPGVLANDDDADGDSLTASLVDGGGNGSLSLNSNGGFTFKSGGSFTGTRTFTYRVTDGISSSGTATVSIEVAEASPTPTPKPTPTPAPTPAPTATPTPRPTPTPTPRPTATPTPRPTATPTPTPRLPLPTLPLPTLPLPTLPLPTLIPTPIPTPAPGATATPAPSASPSGQPVPGATPAPGETPGASGPLASGSASDAPVGAGGTTGGAGSGGGGATTDRFELPGVERAGIDDIIDASFTGFGGVEWAVPAFALGVPGLLLILAVGAQALVSVAWLPMVRRWLGGFGVRRRQRA